MCRLLMPVPGVGPATALAFGTAVEDPARLAGSQLLGAYTAHAEETVWTWRAHRPRWLRPRRRGAEAAAALSFESLLPG